MQEFEHSPAPDHNHHIRKLQLPSGKTIEVISFEQSAPVRRELHRCPECEGDLVYPTAWEQSGAWHWRVSLRCPDCEWTVTDIFEDAATQDLDERLDRGTEVLLEDLRELARANMAADVDRLIAAIADGHVLPEDF